MREKQFQRNDKLEKLLKEINSDLWTSEREVLNNDYKVYPVVFVMGALRSGTTLTTQWLANTGEFAYPSNLMSRFYNAPIIGAKLHKLLVDPEYNFRNELMDFSKPVEYHSQNGKTRGASSPNEFWYFWRRFFPYQELENDYLPDDELEKRMDKKTFLKELMGIANVFDKPMAMKGMIANYNIPLLDKIFPKALFIHVKRDVETNIASVLEARKRQLGSEAAWYSFRIPEMQELMQITENEVQIAGQLDCINTAIAKGLEGVDDSRKMVLDYEQFCENPQKYYELIREKLELQGYSISEEYVGQQQFDLSRKDTPSSISAACLKWKEHYRDRIVKVSDIL